MAVTVYDIQTDRMTDADIAPWRETPVAVAVDLSVDIGQIDPAIRPLMLAGRQPRLFGRAVTAQCVPPDFGAVVHALDQIQAGDVLMISAAGNRDFAMIGDVLGGHLRRIGCVGIVCDGAVRDVGMLAQWADFSVYLRFITPRGPQSAEKGVVNGPVVIGGQIVHPGDLVIGDDDGLAVLSAHAVRTHLNGALEKLKKEAGWMESLAAGRSAAETFGLKASIQLPSKSPV